MKKRLCFLIPGAQPRDQVRQKTLKQELHYLCIEIDSV